MSSSPPRTFSRSRVATAIIVNLTATPGLGSVMCGRLWEGLGQLAFSATGFCLIVVWMVQLIYRSVMEQMENAGPPTPAGWMWKWGALLFGAGWLWSLITSISLWQHAKKDISDVPPRITNPPGKM